MTCQSLTPSQRPHVFHSSGVTQGTATTGVFGCAKPDKLQNIPCPFWPPNRYPVAAQAPVDFPFAVDWGPGCVSQAGKHDLHSQQHDQPCPCPRECVEAKNAASEEELSHPFSGHPPKSPCGPPSPTGSPSRMVPFPLPRLGGMFSNRAPRVQGAKIQKHPSPCKQAAKRCRAKLPLLTLLSPLRNRLPLMFHKPQQPES